MPSPIAHISVGYMLYRVFVRYIPAWKHDNHRLRVVARLCAFIFLSMLPDIDAIIGILTGDMGRYHNQWTHSLIMASTAALLIAFALCSLLREKLKLWIIASILCCGVHVLMDTISHGRGVLLLWPLTEHRFSSPVLLFMGLHWSQGVWSPMHLLTALNEILFVAVLYGVAKVTWSTDRK